VEKIKSSLFYLLLVFLPLQLGRHFFFDFAFISGLRSDYLVPTLYLTDILIILLIILWFVEEISYKVVNLKSQVQAARYQTNSKVKNLNFNIVKRLEFWILIFFIVYLFINVFFIATNQWAALYKLVKILEFFLLGMVVAKIKPKVVAVVFFLSIGMIYSGFLAFSQFILQRSVGGFFYFLGERTFYAGTPGIATVYFNNGLMLRPYATFPHPNVLGGALAVLLPMVFYFVALNKKPVAFLLQMFFSAVFILGLITLFLTFSRASWAVFLLGFALVFFVGKKKILLWLEKNKDKTLLFFYSLFFLSVLFFWLVPSYSNSILQRRELLKAAFEMILQNPLFGVGLNNFVVAAKDYLPKIADPYIFQPVHNVYLLVFSELGIIGFVVIITLVYFTFLQSLKSHPLIIVAVLQLAFLGFFDHYLFTLQQAQLLFVVFVALAFCRGKN